MLGSSKDAFRSTSGGRAAGRCSAFLFYHGTCGVCAALDHLNVAGWRAIWGTHNRCKCFAITRFSPSAPASLHRELAEPVRIAHTGTQIWGPELHLCGNCI